MCKKRTDVKLLNKKQAAEYLGISPKTVRRTFKDHESFRKLFKPQGTLYYTTAEKLDAYFRD